MKKLLIVVCALMGHLFAAAAAVGELHGALELPCGVPNDWALLQSRDDKSLFWIPADAFILDFNDAWPILWDKEIVVVPPTTNISEIVILNGSEIVCTIPAGKMLKAFRYWRLLTTVKGLER